MDWESSILLSLFQDWPALSAGPLLYSTGQSWSRESKWHSWNWKGWAREDCRWWRWAFPQHYLAFVRVSDLRGQVRFCILMALKKVAITWGLEI